MNKEDTLPVAKINSSKIISRSGEKVSIACLATGIPNPSIYWTKDDDEHIISNGAVIAFQFVNNVHTGEYHCHAHNRKGKSRVSTLLEVIGT